MSFEGLMVWYGVGSTETAWYRYHEANPRERDSHGADGDSKFEHRNLFDDEATSRSSDVNRLKIYVSPNVSRFFNCVLTFHIIET